jgi:hypothetical protein
MSGILETLKFLGSSWLEVAVAVDKRLETQAARIAELEAENAGLSANQCLHDIHGDESGNLYCPRIAELEAALKDMAKHVWRGDWDKLKPETRALLDEKK